MADKRKATHVNPELHERLRVLNFQKRVQIQQMIDVAVTAFLDKAETATDKWWAKRFPELAQDDG